jgi:UDP-N-acetylmuramyl pentapeptide phosphotransferase/UDP-N-acetylglucosamine-1-phosphate transferase
VAVFVGFVSAVAIALHFEYVPLRPVVPLLIAALPVFLVGLWEDITHRVPPKYRMFAAVFSAALASAFAHGVLPRLDLRFVDSWLDYLPIAVALTCFMVAGACNAFNIIDGTNGLAGGSALLMFAGLAAIAAMVGDTLVLTQAEAMTGACWASCYELPKAKSFWRCRRLFHRLHVRRAFDSACRRNAAVSAWFVIALAAYPIVETLYSMYRRKILRHAAAMQPDIRHLHSLLYLHFLDAAQRRPRESGGGVRGGIGTLSRQGASATSRRANARVAPQLWLHGALCFAISFLFYSNTPVLIGFTLSYALLYVICYRAAARLSGENTKARLPILSPGDD